VAALLVEDGLDRETIGGQQDAPTGAQTRFPSTFLKMLALLSPRSKAASTRVGVPLASGGRSFEQSVDDHALVANAWVVLIGGPADYRCCWLKNTGWRSSRLADVPATTLLRSSGMGSPAHAGGASLVDLAANECRSNREL